MVIIMPIYIFIWIAGVEIHMISSVMDQINFSKHFECIKKTLSYLNNFSIQNV